MGTTFLLSSSDTTLLTLPTVVMRKTLEAFTKTPKAVDPLLDLVSLLRPKATLWREIAATGRWAITFPKRDDLLFCSVLQGECLVVRPAIEPVTLHKGDFLLIRTGTPFRFASDTRVSAKNSEREFSASRTGSIQLGTGGDRPVLLLGGRFVLDTTNESLITQQMPSLIHVGADAKRSQRIQNLLGMNALENAAGEPGSDFVIQRLMELLFVELLRDEARRSGSANPGLLAGLAHPVTATALQCMHTEPARGWTVEALARRSGTSRSRFAHEFHSLVGTSPMRYLLNWRIALAKERLRSGTHSLSDIAFDVGFHSVSAFSTAFRRSVGHSPKQFAEVFSAVSDGPSWAFPARPPSISP